MDKKDIKFLIIGLLVSIVLALFISPFSSSAPDGLEKVAKELGFAELAEEDGVTAWNSPLAGYEAPGIKINFFKSGVAGLIGTVILFLIAFLFAKMISKKKLSKGGVK